MIACGASGNEYFVSSIMKIKLVNWDECSCGRLGSLINTSRSDKDTDPREIF